MEELRGVQERLCNFERLNIFQTTILRQACHVAASHAIRQRIEKRIDAGEKFLHGMLVEETLHTWAQYRTVSRS